MRSLAVYFLAAILAVSAIPAFAQQAPSGTITGKIVIGRGEMPSRRIEVKLETRGIPAGVTYADNEGNYSFSDLPPNIYRVSITDPEYVPIQQQAILRGVLGEMIIVNFDLSPVRADAPADDRRAGSNPYSISAKNLAAKYPKAAIKAFESGVKEQAEGKLDRARGHFQKALEIAPDFYPARNNLGTLLLSSGDYDGARSQFEEVLKTEQNDAAAYFNLGNVDLVTNRYDTSMKELQEGLRREPASAVGQFLLGTLYTRLGRLPEAEKTLQSALQADPNMSTIHLELVNLFVAENRTSDAIAQLKAFLALFPNDPQVPKARQVLQKLQAR